jgi:hypothetical protein
MQMLLAIRVLELHSSFAILVSSFARSATSNASFS